MLKRIKKIWSSFCRVILSEKKWCWPRQSEVLIFDASRQVVLKEFLKGCSPEVLHLRGEQFNVPVLLASFFKRGSRADAYVDCFIEKVSPRLIVTYIDNNISFYTISKRHPGVKTLFIQNGSRGYYCDVFESLNKAEQSFLQKLKVDYMLVFGSEIGKKYSRYVAGDTVLIGSIVNNGARKEKSPRLGVIAFVSQWRQSSGINLGGTFYSFDNFWRKPDDLIIQCLINYARLKNKQLVIILGQRASDDLRSNEEAYFRKLMGSEPEFLCPLGSCAGYQAVDSAEVVVSLDSTLGYESIARGNKTAIFSIRGAFVNSLGLNFGWPADFPDAGLFWTNKPDLDGFVRILDYLFEVDGEQWREDIRTSNFSSIMMYDPGNTILKSTLEKIMGLHLPVPKT